MTTNSAARSFINVGEWTNGTGAARFGELNEPSGCPRLATARPQPPTATGCWPLRP